MLGLAIWLTRDSDKLLQQPLDNKPFAWSLGAFLGALANNGIAFSA